MKKYLIVLTIFISYYLPLSSQNLIMADEKLIHFGFTLGINVMDYGIKPSNIQTGGVIYNADVDRLIPGFSVGVIGDLRMGEYFNLRLIPTLHIGQRDLSYVNDKNNNIEYQNIKANILTLPLYVKYSAVRIRNYRPYLIVGGGLAFDLGREREKPVLLKTFDYFVDFGVGCTIYFPFFRFSPEIKFGMGFNNIITPLEERPKDYIVEENKRFTQVLSRLSSRIFTLTFNFE